MLASLACAFSIFFVIVLNASDGSRSFSSMRPTPLSTVAIICPAPDSMWDRVSSSETTFFGGERRERKKEKDKSVSVAIGDRILQPKAVRFSRGNNRNLFLP